MRTPPPAPPRGGWSLKSGRRFAGPPHHGRRSRPSPRSPDRYEPPGGDRCAGSTATLAARGRVQVYSRLRAPSCSGSVKPAPIHCTGQAVCRRKDRNLRAFHRWRDRWNDADDHQSRRDHRQRGRRQDPEPVAAARRARAKWTAGVHLEVDGRGRRRPFRPLCRAFVGEGAAGRVLQEPARDERGAALTLQEHADLLAAVGHRQEVDRP